MSDLRAAIEKVLGEHEVESINRSHVDCTCSWSSEPTPKPGVAVLYCQHRAHVADAVVAVVQREYHEDTTRNPSSSFHTNSATCLTANTQTKGARDE